MKLATLFMAMILSGVFAHAQGAATETSSAQAGVKAEAPVKKEKKHKKYKKHSKKENASEEVKK